METFVSNERFLFGTRPSIADLVYMPNSNSSSGSNDRFMRKEIPELFLGYTRTADLFGLEGLESMIRLVKF